MMLPFLSREEMDEKLKVLGFEFYTYSWPSHHTELLEDTPEQRIKFQALQELIAGAIAEWSDARPEGDDETWDGYNEELNTWAQEWLVG